MQIAIALCRNFRNSTIIYLFFLKCHGNPASVIILKKRKPGLMSAHVLLPSARRRHGCRLGSLEYERIDSESSVRATGDPNGCCDDGLLSDYPLASPARSPSPPPSAQCCTLVRANTTSSSSALQTGDAGLPGLARGRQSQPSLSVTPHPGCCSPPPVPSSNPCLTLEKPKAAPQYVSIVSPVSCRGLQRSGPVRPPAADDGPSLSLYALL